MKKLILVFSIFASGCASSLYQEISVEELENIKQVPSIPIIQYKSPNFMIMTPTNVAGAGLISKWTNSDKIPAGVAYTQKYSIPDPTEKLVERLVEALTLEGVITERRGNALPLPIPDVPTVNASEPYVLEVSANGWEANYLPMNWKTYAFSVNGVGRLIRTSDNALVWKGYCFQSGYKDDRLEFDVEEFDANNAKKVRAMVDIGTKECADQLVSQLLKNG